MGTEEPGKGIVAQVSCDRITAQPVGQRGGRYRWGLNAGVAGFWRAAAG